jgi:hypothetical protein
MKLKQILKEPYPLSDFDSKLKTGAWFGLFVFLFLFVFRPFGIHSNSIFIILKITFGYGLITFLSMIVGAVIFQFGIRRFIKIDDWDLGKELLISLLNVSFIGFFNVFYSSYCFGFIVDLNSILMFQFYTVVIGFFPTAFFIFLSFDKLNKRYISEASQLNINFKAEKFDLKESEIISFKNDLKEDDFIIKSDDFVYAETADNYVFIYFLENNTLTKKVIRTTLTKIEEDCEKLNNIARTHRSFIVNLKYLEDFSGNAQGLKLKLKNSETLIPVSRKMVDDVKKKIAHFS